MLSTQNAIASTNAIITHKIRNLFHGIAASALSVLQVLLKKCSRQLPCFRGVFGAVAGLVAGVLEGVSGVGEDVDVDGFAHRFHLRFKLVDVCRSDSFVLSAKNAEDWGVDLLQRRVIVAR